MLEYSIKIVQQTLILNLLKKDNNEKVKKISEICTETKFVSTLRNPVIPQEYLKEPQLTWTKWNHVLHVAKSVFIFDSSKGTIFNECQLIILKVSKMEKETYQNLTLL